MAMGATGRRNDHLGTISSSILSQVHSKESISLQNLLKNLVLGFIVRHSVVNLDWIHDEDVSDDGNDELGHPIGVAEEEKSTGYLLDCIFTEPYTVYFVKML